MYFIHVWLFANLHDKKCAKITTINLKNIQPHNQYHEGFMYNFKAVKLHKESFLLYKVTIQSQLAYNHTDLTGKVIL